MGNLKFITYNVRGLGDYVKRREVFNYLHTKEYDVCFLQEMHGENKTMGLWSSQWGSKIWGSWGTKNAIC